MSENWYSKAIDILLSKDTDFKQIVIEIAKKHPKLVTDAHFTLEIRGLQKQVKSSKRGEHHGNPKI